MASTATSGSTGMSVEVDSKLWLAKGIGTIRTEQSGTSLDVTGTLAIELLSTNLVP